jgi:transcription elongation factor SPT6
VLEERYITRKDEGIKQSDVPERLQLRFPNRPIPEERDLVNEATWIHKFLSLPEGLESEKVVPKIANVLRNLLVNRMEIPFILNYRRDYWVPELEASHLWEIFDLDEKWFYLQSRKESLTLVYQAHEHVSLFPKNYVWVVLMVYRLGPCR